MALTEMSVNPFIDEMEQLLWSLQRGTLLLKIEQ